MPINTITSDDVYEDLCVKIEKLELMPGTKLSENELAANYGVSRHIIRGALAHLRGRRLIETYPQRGTYVSLIDMDYISDILFMRNAVEQEAITAILWAEDSVRKEYVERLRDIVKKQKSLKKGDSYDDDFYELDNAFHQIFFEAAGRPNVMELIADPYIHIRRWRNYEIRSNERMSEIIEEHARITEAVAKKDEALTRAELHKHLDTVARYSKPLKDAEAQYFV